MTQLDSKGEPNGIQLAPNYKISSFETPFPILERLFSVLEYPSAVLKPPFLF
jgi:hypothetical protein